MYAQLIDDEKGITIVSAADIDIAKSNTNKKPHQGVDIARETGKLLAQRAKEKKIVAVVFDRSGYQYHGRVKALAEGAREGGLQF